MAAEGEYLDGAPCCGFGGEVMNVFRCVMSGVTGGRVCDVAAGTGAYGDCDRWPAKGADCGAVYRDEVAAGGWLGAPWPEDCV